MSTTDDYSEITEEIKQLAENGIVFLIPPGSHRGELVKNLKGSGLEILVYEQLYNRICNGSCDYMNIRLVNKDFLVEGKDLVEYIKNGRKLKDALERKVIVPESTAEFLLLIDQIRKKFVEEITGEGNDREEAEKKAKEIIDGHIKVFFLPKLYEEKYNDLKKDVRQFVGVDYTSILKDLIDRPKGISPKLVEAAKENQEYVKKGVEAIRALYPEKLGLGDVLKDIKEFFPIALTKAALSASISVLIGPSLTNAILSLANILMLKISKQTSETSITEFLKELASSPWEIIKKKKDRDRILDSIPKLINAAINAEEHIKDEIFEAVVDEVACKWGLSVEEFKKFIDNFYKLTNGKLITEDELKKEIEELKKEFDKSIKVLSVSPDSTFFDVDSWQDVKESGKGLMLKESLLTNAVYVDTPLEEELSSKLNETAKNGGGLIILKGKKGVGKSTAASVALWKILKQNKLIVEGKQGIYRPVIVKIYISTMTEEGFLDKLKDFINIARQNEFLPIFYIDPSKASAYEQGVYNPENFTNGFKDAINKILKNDIVLKNAIFLDVLSNDQYKLVVKDGLDELVKEETKSFSLVDADEILEEKDKKVQLKLISDIIEDNSDCKQKLSQDVVQKLADLISENFDDNYILIAALVADRLKKSGCKVEEVESSIENAKHQVHKFILDYIWKGVLGGDEDFSRRHAPLIIATGLIGYHPLDWGKALIKAFGYMPRDDIVKWFTLPLHDTIYEVIREIAESAAKRAFNIHSMKDICDEDSGEPCKFVEMSAEHLIEADIPIKKYKNLNEIADKYAEKVAEKLKETRVIRILIKNFMKQFDAEEKDGTWEIVHRIKMGNREKEIKGIYDDVDALLMMESQLEKFDSSSTTESKKLGDLPIEESVKEHEYEEKLSKDLSKQPPILYLHNLITMYLKSEEGIIARAEKILEDIEKKGYISKLDLLRGLAILKETSFIIMTTKKDVESIKALSKLSALLANSNYYSSIEEAKKILYNMRGERKKMNESEEVAKHIADYISMVLHNPRYSFNTLYGDLQYLPFYDGQPITIGSVNDETIPDSEKRIVIKYFDTLYNASSKIGKFALLDKLLCLYSEDYIFSDPIKPWEYLGQQDSKNFCDLIAQRVNNLLDESKKENERFEKDERNIAASLLYSGLAQCYARNGELDKAEKYANDANAVVNTITVDDYKKLKDYLEIWFLRPDLAEESDLLRQIVLWRLSIAYFDIGKKDIAEALDSEACRIAKELGGAENVLVSCILTLVFNNLSDLIKKIDEGIESFYKSLLSILLGFGITIETIEQFIEELFGKNGN